MIVIAGTPFGMETTTRGQLRDLPGVDSLYFTMLNHNKRSITLNTKTGRGRAIFTRLVEECDVLGVCAVETMRQ